MNLKPPLLSVIIPAYNVERYIDEAVQSALGQMEPFYQIIVVNDGSTDGTARRLAAYAHDDRVRVVETANQGLGPARNEGLKYATGDFVYFLDSDDVLPPDFVSRISATVRRHPGVDLVFFSGEIFYDDDYRAAPGEQSRPDEFRRRVAGVYPSGLDAAGAMLESGLFSPSACLYVSRRSLWDDLRFKPIVHEDDEVIARLCARSRMTYVGQEALYLRRIRNGSIMSSKTSRRNADGYFSALESTWRVLLGTHKPRHRAIVLRQFRAQAWQYLHACRRAEIKPGLTEMLFLLKRLAHIPKADLLRTVTPPAIKARIRQGRRLAA